MPPDAPAPTENAAPAPEAGTPTSQATKPRGAALIEKHVKLADKARAEEAKAELAKTDLSLAGAPTERERDPKTGHFLPAGAKPKKDVAVPAGPATPKAAAQPVGDTTKKPDEPLAAGLGKARRLVNEGRIGDALQLIGLDPEKLESGKWAAWRKNNEKVAAAIHERSQAVEAKEREVQASARQLVQDLAPFIRGKQAFDKGDYEEAFQQAFGIDINTFQRKALQSMAQPGVGKDPAVLALRQEIQALRQERENERQQWQQAQQEQGLQQRRQQAWNGNVQALADSGDPKMSQLAQNPKFMQMVWRVQGEHYDQSTDSTLPALEAAELAMERLQSEFSEWQPVFGGSAPDANASRARQISAATGPSGTSARRTARAVTTLNPSEAAEAAPRTKLRGRALIDYHANLAKMAELRGDLNGHSE